MHVCTVCFKPMDSHSEGCDCGERHFPPLCCKGCDCGSYESAHAGLVGNEYAGPYPKDIGAFWPED